MNYTPKEKQFSCRWILDGIGTDYTQWACKDEQIRFASASRVFIESPTGTGKTTFILKTLMPFARENGRNILYLGNRTALREQTRYAAQNALIQTNHPDLQITDANDGSVFFYSENSPNSITVLNYQAFLGFVKCNHFGTPPLGNPFYYIIFDEAHFFLEDSLFNPMTWAVLEKLMAYFNNSVFIFMSATMEESVYPLLCTLDMFRPAHSQQLVYDSLYKPDIYFYQNTFREAKYKVRFFISKQKLYKRLPIRIAVKNGLFSFPQSA